MLSLVLKDSCTKIPHSYLNTVRTLHHSHQPHKLVFLFCYCCCNITMPHKTRNCCYFPLSIHIDSQGLDINISYFPFPNNACSLFLEGRTDFLLSNTNSFTRTNNKPF